MIKKRKLPFIWGVGFAQLCSWGTLYYAFPQVAAAMEVDLGWSKSQLYGALTLGLLLSAAAAIPVGAAIDKGAGRIVMTIGSVVAGLLFFGWSATNSIIVFYFVLACLGLLQAALLYTAIFAVIARHCDKNRTREYLTSITLWGGFASTVFIPLIEVMLGFLSWRQVLVVLGSINLGICAVIYWHLPHKAIYADDEQGGKESSDQGIGKWVLRQPVFWVLLACFCIHALIENAFRFHLYPIYLDNGISKEKAVFLLALLGPAQVVGRFALKLFKKISADGLGIAMTMVFPLALFTMEVFRDSVLVQALAILFYGAAAGIMTIVNGTAIPEFISKKSYGLISGMMNVPILILRAIAPSVAALLWTMSGSYSGLMYSLVLLGVVMAILFATATRLSVFRKPAKG